MIPCAEQCHSVLSQLCMAKEENGSKFYYIQFPFGSVDYKGLKEFQAYHEEDYEHHVTTEEIEWLKKCQHTISTDKPIFNNMLQKIETYFKEMVWTGLIPEKGKQLRNLVGRRWTTDSEITAIFDLLNKQHRDALYFTARPTKFLYAFSTLRDKLCLVKESDITLRQIYVAINVGCSHDSKYYVADGKREGCHWALLFVDLERCQSYYGDSLGWPLPTNLEEVVKPNIKEIEKVLHADLWNSVGNITALHKTTEQKHRCSSCDFYPLQTCSNVCGVVTMAMAAVLSDCQQYWPRLSTSHGQHEWLLYPSEYSDQLRIMIMDWLMKEKVDIGIILHADIHSNIHYCKDATNIKHDTDNLKESYGSNSQSKCFTSDSDSDDFEDIHKKGSSKMTSTMNSPTFTQFSDPESDTDYIFNKGTIRKLLPETYDYRFSQIQYGKSESLTFSCEFKINMKSEQEARIWVNEYNEKN